MIGRKIAPRLDGTARKAIDQQAGAEIDRPVHAGRVAHDIRVGRGAIDVLQQRVDGGEPIEERLRQFGEVACASGHGHRR